ncbi:MAG: hypothetical protein ABI353_22825, partial [Isosphaeraceae bacterium]
PGDYDGDGKADYAVYQPSSGKLFVLPSNGSSAYILQFGPTNNVPYLGPIKAPASVNALRIASFARPTNLTDVVIDTIAGDATTSFLSLPTDARRKRA